MLRSSALHLEMQPYASLRTVFPTVAAASGAGRRQVSSLAGFL